MMWIYKEKMLSTLVLWLSILGLSIGLSGCGSSGDDEFKEAIFVNDMNITSIEVTRLNDIFGVDATEQFKALAIIDSDEDNTLNITTKVTWSSSDNSIVSIDASGVATAVGEDFGTVEITAELADLSAFEEITSSNAVLTAITIKIQDTSKNDVTTVGICSLEQAFLTAEGAYEDGPRDLSSKVSWSSGSPAIAIINENDDERRITGLAIGSADITATFQDIGSDALPVTVDSSLETITITPAAITIYAGETQQFKAMGRYTDLTGDQDITTTVVWDAVNIDATTDKYLTFSSVTGNNGLAAGQEKGDVSVTATCAGANDASKASVAVSVEDAITVDRIEINGNKGTESADVGDSAIQLVAKLVYSDGSEEDVTNSTFVLWSVNSLNNGTSATVNNTNSKGEVTFTATGSTKIKVVYNDNDGVEKEDTIDIDIN